MYGVLHLLIESDFQKHKVQILKFEGKFCATPRTIKIEKLNILITLGHSTLPEVHPITLNFNILALMVFYSHKNGLQKNSPVR